MPEHFYLSKHHGYSIYSKLNISEALVIDIFAYGIAQ